MHPELRRDRERLLSERLRAEPAAERHVDLLHAHWTHPLVRRHLWDDLIIDRHEVQRALERSRRSAERTGLGLCCLWRRDDPRRFVGVAGILTDTDDGPGELLFSLEPACWGQGLASEAARLLLAEAATLMPGRTVIATVDVGNERSHAVLRRLGATAVARDAEQGRLRYELGPARG